MTEDEAKELSGQDLYDEVSVVADEDWRTEDDTIRIIQQNWPQISKQLDKWFNPDWYPYNLWYENPEFLEDPIGWMLRAYVARNNQCQ